MAKRVQRLGHTTAIANTFIGLEREITVDVTTGELRIHDGVTAGGKRLLNKTQNDALYQPLGTIEYDTLKVDQIDEKTLGVGVTVETVLIKDGLVDGRDVSVDAVTLNSHIANVSNPHVVTKTQVGLSAVVNALQAQTANNLSDLASLSTAFSNLVAALASGGLITRTAAGAVALRTILGTANQIALSNGAGDAGNPIVALASDPTIPGTGSLILPSGTTAQQSGGQGGVRYNTETDFFEININGTWRAIGRGGDDTLTELVASASASLAFPFNAYLADYEDFDFILSNVLLATNNQVIRLQTSIDNGSTWSTTLGDYFWSGVHNYGSILEALFTTSSGDTGISLSLGLSMGNQANAGYHGTVRLINPAAVQIPKIFFDVSAQKSGETYAGNGAVRRMNGIGVRNSAAAINAIRFIPSSGNIASGKITMKGRRKA